MSIPVISDIIDGVKWFIDFFMNKAPNPVKFFLFLVLLLAFASLIPFFLQMAGIHCNADGQVMKTNLFSFIKNWDIIDTKDEIFVAQTLSFNLVHPNTKDDTCFEYMQVDAYDEYASCEENGSNTTGCNYYYKEPLDYDCESIKLCSKFLFFCTWYDYCTGDVKASTDGLSKFSEFQDKDVPVISSWTGSHECWIPNGYAWSFDEGNYYCYNQTVCGNGTQGFHLVDEKLENMGATPFYEDPNEKSYKNMVSMRCSKNLNPELGVFGLPIFDYKIWVFGTLVFFMGYFLVRMKK